MGKLEQVGVQWCCSRLKVCVVFFWVSVGTWRRRKEAESLESSGVAAGEGTEGRQ